MRIGVDAMGGENAPREVVKGALEAARKRGGEMVLVGRRGEVEEVLADYRLSGLSISIVNADEVVGFDEHPAQAVRHKRNSSIVVGMKLLKEGEVSAFVSAGNSGAVMAAALLILGSIPGVERPALGYLFTTPWHTLLLLDVGANADCKPSFLVQFAQMGSVYMERVFGIPQPRVGLLSIGGEESKGNQLIRESHELLKGTSLNFVGNVEGNDMPKGVVDVLVTDGFTGNVVLKAGEGLGEMVIYSLNQAIARRPYLRVVSFVLQQTFRSAIRSLDYAEHGGVPLLGVNGNVIIAHGRSDARAIKNAIVIAKQAAEQRAVEAIRMGIK